jgi:hypothetical protein
MSTLSQKKSPLQTTPAKQPKYIYLGLNESGRIRLELGDKTLLINGAVYASTTPATGQTKVVLVPVNSTPGYQREPSHKKFLARTPTGETFRIIGTVENTLTTAPIQKKGVRTILSSASNTQDNPTLAPASSPKHATPATVPAPPKPAQPKPADAKKQAKLARLQKEFKRVNLKTAVTRPPRGLAVVAARRCGG